MAERRRVVDAHLHLWDPRRLSMSWLADAPGLDRAFSAADQASVAGPLGIDAAVLVEAAVDESSLEQEIDWMRGHLAADGMVVGAVAGWRPEGDPEITVAWLDRLADESGVVGVREVLHPTALDESAPASPRRIAAAVEAGRRGLVVDICARPDQLAAVRRLAEAAPDTRFVVDHLGRPRSAAPVDEGWRRDLAALAACPNAVVKISALVECAEGADWDAAMFRPFIRGGVELFGPSRCLWGSNWPVCGREAGGLARWFDAMVAAINDLAETEQAEIMGGTADRVYGLMID